MKKEEDKKSLKINWKQGMSKFMHCLDMQKRVHVTMQVKLDGAKQHIYRQILRMQIFIFNSMLQF